MARKLTTIERKSPPMKPHSKTWEVFRFLIDGMDLFVSFGANPSGYAYYGGMGGLRSRRKEQEYWDEIRALRRLEERKLIRVRKAGKRLQVKLTKTGAIEAIRQEVMAADLLPDGRVCMVVFDIPESQRKVRRSLRAFLDALAFIPLQQSVWITPFDAIVPLTRYFRATQKDRWVRVYTAIESK